jgi:hypothetical protein
MRGPPPKSFSVRRQSLRVRGHSHSDFMASRTLEIAVEQQAMRSALLFFQGGKRRHLNIVSVANICN